MNQQSTVGDKRALLSASRPSGAAVMEAKLTDDLKRIALKMLKSAGVHESSFEYKVVRDDQMSHSVPTEYLLNSIIAHCHQFPLMKIINACIDVAPVMALEAAGLSSDHMLVMRRFGPLRGHSSSALLKDDREYGAVFRYTVEHAEDWELIEPLIFDRGIRGELELTEILSTVKTSGHSRLAVDGAL